MKQPAYVNLLGSWLLTFVLSIGKLMSLTDLDWWWVLAPILVSNGIFAGVAIMRGLLYKGLPNEDYQG